MVKDYSPHFVYLPKDELEKKAVKDLKKDVKYSPLSGSEPKYEPDKWNNNERIKEGHNCYSYAVDQRFSGRKGKPQPGYYSGYNHILEEDYSCSNFRERLSRDFPSLYLSSFGSKCLEGFHKGFIAYVSKLGDRDYHFYREDKNGLWSHKPGRTNAINIDSDNKLISNPLKANRDYNYFNYDNPCFFFCVNKKLGHAHSKTVNSKKSFFNFNF